MEDATRSESPSRPAWDGFVSGEENALALAAAQLLARGESAGVSPLVVFGPSGGGKTFLIEALVSDRVARRPETAVAWLRAEEFASACSQAADRRDPKIWAELRRRFRGVDLLALDDLQTLGRWTLALDELANTLDALEDAGAAVVATARTAPALWAGWPRRLVNRFWGGLAIRIDPPSIESRRRFLIDRFTRAGARIDSNVIEALAESANTYRALEGACTRWLWSRNRQRPSDLETARDDDSATIPDVDRRIQAVVGAVSAHYGCRPRDLIRADRRPSVVEARGLAIYLAHEMSHASISALARSFGGRDRATIRHALRVTRERRERDPAFDAAARALAGVAERGVEAMTG